MTAIPSWLEPLVEAVAASITVHGPDGPLGLRFRQLDGRWDVLIYPLPVEMIGGEHDGGLAAPGFVLDLHAVSSAFARVDVLGWDALGTCPENASGPCLSVEGAYGGREVWLRVLAYAPGDVGPAAKG